MTRRQKEEALRRYFTLGQEMEQIAQEMGAPPAQVLSALNDLTLLRPYMERAEAAKLRAQICVNESAEEAARKQAQLMLMGEAAGQQSVSQRAAKDILDRAGVSIDAGGPRDIRIVFVGMPQLGMPRGEEERDGNPA